MARVCLCVNQIAHIRNMNKTKSPDPVAAALAAEMAGIDGIVVQLRDDRMDITDRDITVLKEVVQSHLNVCVTLNDEMIKKALNWLPDMVTLVPAVGEFSHENSLDVAANLEYIEDIATTLRANKIVVNALINPDSQQIRAAARARLDYVQFNTWSLSQIEDMGTMNDRVELFKSVAMAASKLGLGVSVGRGLTEQVLRALAEVTCFEEFNIGRAIVSRSLMVGMEKSVRHFKFMLS